MPKRIEGTTEEVLKRKMEQNRLHQQTFLNKDSNRELFNAKRREAYALKKQQLLQSLGLAPPPPPPTIIQPLATPTPIQRGRPQRQKKTVATPPPVQNNDNEDEQNEDEEEQQSFKFNKNTNTIDMSHLKVLSLETAEAAFKYLLDKQLLKSNTFTTRRTALRLLVKITKCDNLLDCFNKHMDKIIKQVKEGKKVTSKGVESYSNSSLINVFETIGYMIDNFKINVSKANHQKIKDIDDEVIIDRNKAQKEKQAAERVPTFQDYEAKVKEVFGENSEMDLITQLYGFTLGARDDFGLIIVGSEAEANDYKGDNFIIVPRENIYKVKKVNCTIIIDNFKTKESYEGYHLQLSADLSRKLRKYITENNRQYGDYLFGNNKLSQFINAANKTLREKHNFMQQCAGGVNAFRKILASRLQDYENMSSADQLKEARKFRHSKEVHLKYLRLLTSEQNND
jgi:hypothetical protein